MDSWIFRTARKICLFAFGADIFVHAIIGGMSVLSAAEKLHGHRYDTDRGTEYDCLQYHHGRDLLLLYGFIPFIDKRFTVFIHADYPRFGFGQAVFCRMGQSGMAPGTDEG